MTPPSMFPRVPRPKARTAKKRQPKAKAAVHVFIWDASSDWRGQPFCKECDQPRNHPAHDLTGTPAEAAEIDARKLGEGESVAP